MSENALNEWFQRQNYRVVETNNSAWVETNARIYQAIPYHRLIEPTSPEIDSLFTSSHAVAIRYSTKWFAGEGMASYHVVYEGGDFPLAAMPKKARHDVLRGMNASKIEAISFDSLADEGWQLRQETLRRQGRVNAETRGWWKQLCLSAEGLKGFEAWAGFVDGRMAAALLAYSDEDCCSILYQQSRTEFLPSGINNALVYIFSNEVLKREGKQRIFYGLHSLDAPASVDRFKFRMGYLAKPVRQRVVFNPRYAPLVNKVTHGGLKMMHQLFPANRLFAKAEGMVRFCLQGKSPLEEQDWPEALMDQKEAILKKEAGT